MPFDPNIVASAVDAAANVYKIGKGIADNAKANKLSRSYVDPKYNIPQPILDNQALAERDASQGMSDGARIAYENNADRGLSTSIDAIIRGGGGINSFSNFYDNYSNDFGKIAMLDDELRRSSKATLMQQNERLADEQDKKWQLNVWKPAQDQKAYIASLRNQGAANISGGIDGLAGGAQRYAQGKLYDNDGRWGGGPDLPEMNHSMAPMQTSYGQGVEPQMPGYADPNFRTPSNGYGYSPQYGFGNFDPHINPYSHVAQRYITR